MINHLQEGPPRPALAAEAVTGRRILVVDDHLDNATSLAMLLEMSGNATEAVYDGCEAVERAATYRPDIVLLDLGLPGMSGYDACRAMRQHSWGRDMTIVAVSGWGQDEDRRKSSDAGFDGHLVKPVHFAQLNQLLLSLPQR